jgi:hypothetical protein
LTTETDTAFPIVRLVDTPASEYPSVIIFRGRVRVHIGGGIYR